MRRLASEEVSFLLNNLKKTYEKNFISRLLSESHLGVFLVEKSDPQVDYLKNDKTICKMIPWRAGDEKVDGGNFRLYFESRYSADNALSWEGDLLFVSPRTIFVVRVEDRFPIHHPRREESPDEKMLMLCYVLKRGKSYGDSYRWRGLFGKKIEFTMDSLFEDDFPSLLAVRYQRIRIGDHLSSSFYFFDAYLFTKGHPKLPTVEGFAYHYQDEMINEILETMHQYYPLEFPPANEVSPSRRLRIVEEFAERHDVVMDCQFSWLYEPDEVMDRSFHEIMRKVVTVTEKEEWENALFQNNPKKKKGR